MVDPEVEVETEVLVDEVNKETPAVAVAEQADMMAMAGKGKLELVDLDWLAVAEQAVEV